MRFAQIVSRGKFGSRRMAEGQSPCEEALDRNRHERAGPRWRRRVRKLDSAAANFRHWSVQHADHFTTELVRHWPARLCGTKWRTTTSSPGWSAPGPTRTPAFKPANLDGQPCTADDGAPPAGHPHTARAATRTPRERCPPAARTRCFRVAHAPPTPPSRRPPHARARSPCAAQRAPLPAMTLLTTAVAATGWTAAALSGCAGAVPRAHCGHAPRRGVGRHLGGGSLVACAAGG